ncbi:CUB and sushi domain-containing protein 1-like [Corticium candelabrum]|uniref:CUB and sushi domain-containing protein 1-like n=1 Tax=Corticium candelabrum TaxID=121492 RepID=UPI002E262919|nr:CUB and sushi domain-containing protein 1-like [Corticium candelabrum]
MVLAFTQLLVATFVVVRCTGSDASVVPRCHCPPPPLHHSVKVQPDPENLTYKPDETFGLYCSSSRELVPATLRDTSVRCLEDCKWSVDVSEVRCIERQCPPVNESDLPPNVTLHYMYVNQSRKEIEIECGVLAIFECHKGMERRSGPRFWQCDCDGNWNQQEFPTCKGSDASVVPRCHCPSPPLHHSVEVHPHPENLSYKPDDTLRLYCSSSRELAPATVRGTSVRCREDCKWSVDISEVRCIERQCLPVNESDLPPNVTLHYKYVNLSIGIECGALAVFECHKGMERRSGPRFWQCGCDGNWIPQEFPTCNALTCDALTFPANAYCHSTNAINDIGTSVNCSCGHGFRPKHGGDTGTFVCDIVDDGSSTSWVGDFECEREPSLGFCDEPAIPAYSMRIFSNSDSNYPIGTVLKYVCANGRVLVGHRVIFCNTSSQWSSDPPTCKVASCRKPEVEDKLVIVLTENKPTYLFGSKVAYACPRHYHLVGLIERRCFDQNRWSGTQPQCKKICNEPGVPVNGSRNSEGPFYEGVQVVYQCAQESHLVGDKQISCKADGTWSAVKPVCVKNKESCPDLGIPINATRKNNGPFSIGSHINYKCSPGTRLVGSSRITCQHNGAWTDEIPSCQPAIECEHPHVRDPLVIQMTETFFSYEYRDDIQYTCAQGYKLVGSRRRRCLKRGWSGTEPSCKKRS